MIDLVVFLTDYLYTLYFILHNGCWIFRYAAELHMVYLNSKYQSANEAMNSPDGIAVLAILLYVNVSKNLFIWLLTM